MNPESQAEKELKSYREALIQKIMDSGFTDTQELAEKLCIDIHELVEQAALDKLNKLPLPELLEHL
jgi:hypothetical protein